MQNNPHLLLAADWLIGTWRISELSKPLKAPTARHLQVYSDLTATIPQLFSKASSIWHILEIQIQNCLNILTIFLWLWLWFIQNNDFGPIIQQEMWK